MKSLRKNMASKDGMKASILDSGMAANGAAIPNAASNTATTASANRRCPDVGGRVANKNVGSSETSLTANVALHR